MRSTRVITPVIVAAAAVLLTTGSPAVAKAGDVRTSGACQGVATWKMKAGPEDGRIEVESEVDSNRVGQSWNWTLFHNGNAASSGTSTTAGRSGSFEVRRVLANRAGTDTFRFYARRPGTQQICQGTIRF